MSLSRSFENVVCSIATVIRPVNVGAHRTSADRTSHAAMHFGALLLLALMLPLGAYAHEPPKAAGRAAEKSPDTTADEYPTAALADYVLACMAANGNTFESLHQCSCSIDYIKARMPYETYERASTVMQVQLDTGQRGIFYRDSNWAKTRVKALQSLQAESTLRCF